MNETDAFNQLKTLKRQSEAAKKQEQIDALSYPFSAQEMIDYLSSLEEENAWLYWEKLERAGKDAHREALSFLENRDNLPELIKLFALMMAKYGITWEHETLNGVFGEAYPPNHLHQALNRQEILFLQGNPQWLFNRPYPQFPPIVRADIINRLMILSQKGLVKTDKEQMDKLLKTIGNDGEIRKWLDK